MGSMCVYTVVGKISVRIYTLPKDYTSPISLFRHFHCMNTETFTSVGKPLYSDGCGAGTMQYLQVTLLECTGFTASWPAIAVSETSGVVSAPASPVSMMCVWV